eukprot:TRINITY_DN13220_c0_g2_i1.p2 TRINITY_DN13220_c0_g2~~TRINITY_DN13220_c0_g2_i1.p2  ORF type:complete len:248 (+),score=0.66 TRINITY_DN13220_c0_g2_i1:246-989(+)
MTSVWVVQMHPRIEWAPIGQHLDQAPLGQIPGRHLFKDVGQPQSLSGRAEHEAYIAQGEWAVDFNFLGDTSPLELPAIDCSTRESMANTGDAPQVVRLLWHGVALEERRRPHHYRTHVRANGLRRHVPINSVSKANPRVKSPRDYVDECVTFDDLQPDVWILQKERADYWQQHQLTGLATGGDAQTARRSIAEAIEVFEGIIDIAKRRSQTCVQPFTRFGQRNAAGRAVKQAHAKAIFQRTQSVAQR